MFTKSTLITRFCRRFQADIRPETDDDGSPGFTVDAVMWAYDYPVSAREMIREMIYIYRRERETRAALPIGSLATAYEKRFAGVVSLELTYGAIAIYSPVCRVMSPAAGVEYLTRALETGRP